MNPLLITVFGLVSTTLAMPQYGGNGNSGQIGNLNGGQQGGRQPNLPAGCTIQYKTVYDIVENEKFETKCVEKYRYVHINTHMIKFIYSEKATKIGHNLPVDFFTEEMKNQFGDNFVVFLWPSQDIHMNFILKR